MTDVPIVILDNGASTIKAGVSTSADIEPTIIPNAVIRSKGDKRTYFGHDFEHCKDYSSLHFRLPFEKGYLVDWDAQKAVWDGIFSNEVLGVDTTGSALLITEPYFNLPNIQEVYDQFIFEEYEFQSYYRCTPASLIPFGDLFSRHGFPQPECMLLIDSGFSFTHVVPILNDQIVWSAVKRLDVGGKLLTNQLKELVSFRQWNMMDETYIMNHVKESCCYVSLNFDEDLETSRLDMPSNPIVQEYILPDQTTSRKGRVRKPDEILASNDQILVMNNERFTVPEIIFRPNDLGLEQIGLAGAISLSIGSLPEDLQGLFWANIGLIGGNTKFPNFRSRLLYELRSLAPVDCEVMVYECVEPTIEAYRAAHQFTNMAEFTHRVVTRSEYAEFGSSASRRKFHDWKSYEVEKEKPREVGKVKGKQREDDRSQGPSKLSRTRSKTTSISTTQRRR
ncbi:hypothetical protein AX17_006663 [Amanita inopinata Kibby_2008]|nr:hypothetical protein AX17_006663 [Amanita inopinata Kibby_2008]